MKTMAHKLTVYSPIDDSKVGEVPAFSGDQAGRAVTAAASAQPAWAALRHQERAKVLQAMAQSLRDATDELSDLLTREIGKTPKEARDEVVRSADLIDFTIREAAELGNELIRSEQFPGTKPGRQQTVVRRPLGVVVAIAPFNYPLNLAVSKIAPALIMGNTVVFKPPTQGSVAASRMVKLWQSVLPKDVLVVVTGRASETGDALVTHPQTAMVAMTGSTAVGQHIAAHTGMIPLMFELGGNDPAIVLEDADLELAATHITNGAFKYAGQRCTAVKRVYVIESVADRLVELITVKRDESFGSAGDPRQHPVGPVISDQQADYLQELLDDAVKIGGSVVVGGTRESRTWEATIVDHIPHTSRLVAEEQFGPILPIVRVANAAEAVRMANDSEYGLQACVFTADLTKADELAGQLAVGGIHLNDADQRGPDNFLFIGHKASGLGAQGVRFSLEGMSQLQGIARPVT